MESKIIAETNGSKHGTDGVNGTAPVKRKRKSNGLQGQKEPLREERMGKMTMSRFVSVPFKATGKTPMESMYDIARLEARAPVAGPLADGTFKVTPSGTVSLETLPKTASHRLIRAPIDYIVKNWEAVEAALSPLIGGATVNSSAAPDYSSGKEALNELFNDFQEEDEESALPETDEN